MAFEQSSLRSLSHGLPLGLLSIVFALLLTRACFGQDEVIGHDGKSSLEQTSSNGISKIRIINIPWIPRVTSFSFETAKFNITPKELIHAQGNWFTRDPSFPWRGIKSIELWKELIGDNARLLIYGHDGACLATVPVGKEVSAGRVLGNIENEVKRGYGKIQFKSRTVIGPYSCLYLLIALVIVASVVSSIIKNAKK